MRDEQLGGPEEMGRDELRRGAAGLGRKCADLFQSFVRWTAEGCRENGITKLFFLLREGEFFQNILEELPQSTRAGLAYGVLPVSRMSTFLASMLTFDRSDWERFLNQYQEQSIEALVISLGIPYERTLQLFLQAGLRKDLALAGQLPQFYAAVRSEPLQTFLRQEAARARERLMKYLAQVGLASGPEKIAVADVGWRGTIQDNLCRIFPEKQIVGYYFGLIPMLNCQPENALKHGFVNRMRFSAALLKSHTQLEMLCSSYRGSVLGYEESGAGVLVPVWEDNSRDIDSWNTYARYFQEAILERTRSEPGRASGRKRTGCRAQLLWLTLFPDRRMAQAFFLFRYSERFGLGTDMDLSDRKFSWRPFLRVFRGRKYWGALRAYLNDTMWPQGFLRLHGLSALIPAYNAVLLLQSRKAAKV